jgi:hypothetical protein
LSALIGCWEAAANEIRLNPLPLGTLRRGDALKDVGKWNHAALTVSTACELSPTRIE